MNYQLYRFCRYFFRLGLRFFFRKIEIKGKEKIPAKGPVIVVANHAASFLDAMVVATILRFPVFFIAKARFMSRPMPAWFLRLLNVIPVYRSQDDPKLMDRNQRSFEACYRHLERNGSLLIFPEGVSHSVRQLMKIKTGAARMALGAEESNNFNLGVKIIPLGLNYSNQEKFQSKLFVSVSELIEVASFKEEYLEDNVGAVNHLTEKIEDGINAGIINAGDERRDNIVRRVERLMKYRIMEAWGVPKEDLEQEHLVTKRIMKGMDFLLQKDPVRFAELEKEVNEYFERIQEFDLPETIFKSKKLTSKAVLLYLVYFILGLPFHLAGLAGNFIPYQLSVMFARGWSRNKEYRGAAGFVAGMLVFITAYYFEFRLILEIVRGISIPVAIIISMPFLGLFTFYYWRKLTRFYYKVIFSYSKKKIFVRRLMARRNNIVRELDNVRQEFLASEAVSTQNL